jgi:diacylglycerol kinase (ATP)
MSADSTGSCRRDAGEPPMNPKTGWVAIVNPRARGGFWPAALARGRLSASALARLRADLHTVVDEVLISEHAGHAETLVRQAHAADGILVGGGDGTIFEVLQVLDRGRQRLGILPFGRGNSLARDLKVWSVADGMRGLALGVDRAIDLLHVRARFEDGHEWTGFSASNLALGYPAEVARGAAHWRRLGAQSYAVAAVIARPRWIEVRMAPDGEAPCASSLTGVIVSNSKHVGPFLGFPSADLGDGVFHVMEIRAGWIRQCMHNLSSLTGWRFYEPAVVRDLRETHIVLSRPALLKIDGELREGVRELAVKVLPAAVTFRVPRDHHD